ncbi:MAG: hypothetical protein PHI02_07875 [Sulfurovaceae bacterium]|nr:hypothetical protein [Sulfurovaceae bacterium]
MEENKKTYWPHMIVGFLFLGIGLGIWTLKSASSLPVERENKYMMSYQDADANINEILEKQALFSQNYSIKILNTKIIQVEKDKNSRKSFIDPIELKKGENQFNYSVVDKNGQAVKNAAVTFMLTRPHTDKDDQKFDKINFVNNSYQTPKINITNIGRYTLVARVEIGKTIGFLETSAYLP